MIYGQRSNGETKEKKKGGEDDPKVSRQDPQRLNDENSSSIRSFGVAIAFSFFFLFFSFFLSISKESSEKSLKVLDRTDLILVKRARKRASALESIVLRNFPSSRAVLPGTREIISRNILGKASDRAVIEKRGRIYALRATVILVVYIYMYVRGAENMRGGVSRINSIRAPY